jgi:hypothetical protein
VLDVFFVVSIASFPALMLDSTVLEVSVNEWVAVLAKAVLKTLVSEHQGVLDIVAIID